ncbi:NADH-quinone oxidoreductase subunit M [Thermoleptolyngbya sp. C42_A2020_037]|uniref:NADH-quinone oxidoreductase subunit M n=1 Tax=Thermoleptolyngbya sp. C42_A2020_037 TaxID=2747799 RepID=UPI001A103FF3|nr:NADH-quinone oxidoreductase subunit M [Thermoleptolyngbya sp. C42_A2020_037]MBF2086467.1 NADH-quinone oxidoreductase subunit M [Thermoleptolyngbya sp. C42_A2020_037]
MLSVLIWFPVIGALLISLLPQAQAAARGRQVALVFATMVLAWTGVLVSQFDTSAAGFQFQESLTWIQQLGLSYKLGMDGLSLPLLVLNSLLVWLAIYSTDANLNRPRLWYCLMLLLEAGVAGAFLSENLLLFFLFYEVELIPLYLMVAIWGGARRGYAATKFLIYTALSGILILAAFFGLALLSGTGSFDYAVLQNPALPIATQLVLLITLLIGFGIKIPIVPLHTWLPDTHVEAPTPASVLLAGVLLKLGTYGIVRFGLGLFPETWQIVAPWLAWLAVVNVLYGSFVAIAQTDMKKIVAYSSVGHMGYILLAAAAATPLSIAGAIAQMVSHGLISALLFFLVGVVYAKTGTRDVTVLRGLLTPERGLPLVGSLMIAGVMASAGIPGMVGFIAEYIIYRSSLLVFPIQTLLCMLGVGLTAVYFLNLINRVFFGRLPDALANLPAIYWKDRIPSIVVVVLVIFLGLQPNWMTRWSELTSLSLGTLDDRAIAAALAPRPLRRSVE